LRDEAYSIRATGRIADQGIHMSDQQSESSPVGSIDPLPAAATADGVTVDLAAAEPRLSRKAMWLAMGAVALAIALIWVAPGVDTETPDGVEMARLDFTLQDLNGADVALASFKGKVILLNFWATWCGPCKAEIPELVELQQQYKDDLVVLGVSVDDPVEKLRPYADEYKMNYPVLVGNGQQEFQDAYGPLWGIPVSVIVDRDGRIAKRHSGIGTKERFEQEIKSLL
jgi:thiol-disulfide isomerase/thioredoxin